MIRTMIAALLLFAIALPAQAMGRIEKVVSPSGITAWLVHEPSIPIIALEAYWDGGSRLDPRGREGLANMVSGLLDEGAGDLSSEAFQLRLQETATQLSFDAGRDSFTASMRALSQNRDAAFSLLAKALQAPRFDEGPVERIRGQIISGLRARARDQRELARRALYETAFGDQPYARPVEGTEQSVAAITREDLTGFVRRRLARNNLTLAVVGDITAAELSDRLEQVFAPLPAKAAGPDTGMQKVLGGGVLRQIDYDTPQSQIYIGFPGLMRDDPDFDAARVMTYILGGSGLTSRLGQEVREKRGLTYSIFAAQVPMKKSALYLIGFSSANKTVAEALAVTRRELLRLRDRGVSAKELKAAKTYLNGSFPLSMSSNASIARLLIAIQVNNLGIDYIRRRPQRINAVTAEDIARVAARLFDMKKMFVIAVGRPEGDLKAVLKAAP